MRVAYAFLAKAAEPSEGGCFSALAGGFDSIIVERFPAEHLLMALVARIRFPSSESGEHVYRVEISHEQAGTRHVESEGELVLQSKRYPQHECFANLISQMTLDFDQPGEYRFHVLVDDKELYTVPLSVNPDTPHEAAPDRQEA